MTKTPCSFISLLIHSVEKIVTNILLGIVDDGSNSGYHKKGEIRIKYESGLLVTTIARKLILKLWMTRDTLRLVTSGVSMKAPSFLSLKKS